MMLNSPPTSAIFFGFTIVLLKKFIFYFSFARLTDQYYKTQSWPDIGDLYVNKIIDEGEDETFLILYQELYYRHIYARVSGGPTLEHRFESYFNYCKFFNFILSECSSNYSIEYFIYFYLFIFILFIFYF